MASFGLNGLADRLEAISTRYAEAFSIDRGGDWFLVKVQEEMGELTQAHLAATGRSRRTVGEGRELLAGEVADVLCQLLLYARVSGIDVDRAISDKWLKWEASYGLSPQEEARSDCEPPGSAPRPVMAASEGES